MSYLSKSRFSDVQLWPLTITCLKLALVKPYLWSSNAGLWCHFFCEHQPLLRCVSRYSGRLGKGLVLDHSEILGKIFLYESSQIPLEFSTSGSTHCWTRADRPFPIPISHSPSSESLEPKKINKIKALICLLRKLPEILQLRWTYACIS